ncbi:MAG: folylpolyglutamate synthase/dihydrofolate synthase family protein [Bacteroidia bacterium]|nr:folylpolyglutamate synthase/dihydrofolate synthase family protein [Bacteroidia bacterium]
MTSTLYQETLEYLYSRLPMYQRDGNSAFKKGLDNIQTLCWNIGLPQWKFKSIHVGGTNGKGSVSSMLSSILIEAGYKTGLHTSPHLEHFTERIRINGAEIPEEAVVEFVECYRRIIERVGPSFFELSVAMAFDYFAEQSVDLGVVEVGLGGRLDSTNIIKPEISIITNISWDHTDLLGDTLGKIAYEKAGIIKRYTPVVIGESHPETDPVFLTEAGIQEAPLVFADQRFEVTRIAANLHEQIFEVRKKGKGRQVRRYTVGLAGSYQLQNLRTVLAAVEQLQENGWNISEEAIARGLAQVMANSGLRGRMQQLAQEPTVICDTGHNEAGIQQAISQILNIPHQRLHIVLGMVSNKDHDKILGLLPQAATYYFVKPDIPRGLPALTLQLKAEAFQLEGFIYDTVADGISAALQAASPRDLIYIGGSTFVVAEALPFFQPPPVAA